MHLVGSITFQNEMALCGLPAYSEVRRFPICTGVAYTVRAEIESDQATTVWITRAPARQPRIGKLIAANLSMGGDHGGFLICDSARLAKKSPEYASACYEFHDHFCDAMVSWDSCSFGGWKGNVHDANVIFIPSHEYYALHQADVDGDFVITCKNVFQSG